MAIIRKVLSILLVLEFAGFSRLAGGEPVAKPVDLLIRGAAVVTMNSDHDLFDPGYVAIDKGRIVAVGPVSELAGTRLRPRNIHDARGTVILPGLVNGHTHLAMTLLRGIADDLDLQEWLNRFIFPAEAKNLTREYVAAGTRLGLIEMIRGGITTYADMYYFEETVAEETKRAGLRAVLGQTMIDFPVADSRDWSEAMSRTESFIRRWKGDPLITPAPAPHALYTVSGDHLRQARDLAARHGVPLLTHLAEAPTETEYSLANFHLRPTAYLEQLGILNVPTILAHGVQLDQAEIGLLRKREAGIVHCPQSNMKLSSGTAPVPAMLKAGMRLGLGTDGAASNNDLNLWEEMDTAAKLHKLISGNPTAVSAVQALEMATIGGARALHLDDRIGSLEKGKLADLIVVGLDAPHQTPVYNLYSHLVYATKASDVRDLMVGGKWVMKRRRLLTLAEQPAMQEARLYRDKVARSLGLER